jgi:hypothetical protein
MGHGDTSILPMPDLVPLTPMVSSKEEPWIAERNSHTTQTPIRETENQTEKEHAERDHAERNHAERNHAERGLEFKPSPPSLNLQQLLELCQHSKKLSDTEQKRIRSLLQELLGKPDDAYITHKTIEGASEKLWHLSKELYLAEKLGMNQELEKLSQRLKNKTIQPQLEIQKVEFCRSVDGFGLYDIKSGKELRSGELCIIYVEMTGLFQKNDHEKIEVSPIKTPAFKSAYRSSFQILDHFDNSVFQYNNPREFEDRSHSPRHDSYAWIKWLPNLAPGSYTIKVNINDIYGDRNVQFEKKFKLY